MNRFPFYCCFGADYPLYSSFCNIHSSPAPCPCDFVTGRTPFVPPNPSSLLPHFLENIATFSELPPPILGGLLRGFDHQSLLTLSCESMAIARVVTKCFPACYRLVDDADSPPASLNGVDEDFPPHVIDFLDNCRRVFCDSVYLSSRPTRSILLDLHESIATAVVDASGTRLHLLTHSQYVHVFDVSDIFNPSLHLRYSVSYSPSMIGYVLPYAVGSTAYPTVFFPICHPPREDNTYVIAQIDSSRSGRDYNVVTITLDGFLSESRNYLLRTELHVIADGLFVVGLKAVAVGSYLSALVVLRFGDSCRLDSFDLIGQSPSCFHTFQCTTTHIWYAYTEEGTTYLANYQFENGRITVIHSFASVSPVYSLHLSAIADKHYYVYKSKGVALTTEELTECVTILFNGRRGLRVGYHGKFLSPLLFPETPKSMLPAWLFPRVDPTSGDVDPSSANAFTSPDSTRHQRHFCLSNGFAYFSASTSGRIVVVPLF